jgi:maltooligosyltrehalose trehalohydrolase
MLAWHKQLIELRRTTPDLSDGRIGDLRALFDESARWLCVHRRSITIACNLADRTQCVPLQVDQPRQVLLASGPAIRLAPDHVELSPETVAILALAKDR